MTFAIGPIANAIIGLTSTWQVVWFLTAIWIFFSVVWNVVTVSLRQAVVPANLLGRVNSVYRFFGWGSIPIGSFVAGLIVTFSTHYMSRENSLRLPYFIASFLSILILIFAAPIFTTARIEAVRRDTAR